MNSRIHTENYARLQQQAEKLHIKISKLSDKIKEKDAEIENYDAEVSRLEVEQCSIHAAMTIALSHADTQAIQDRQTIIRLREEVDTLKRQLSVADTRFYTNHQPDK